MAMKIVRLPNLSRVAPGSKSTLELPVGPTYHRINFQASGTGLAVEHIGRIDVLINGKVVQTFSSLQRLIDLNTFHGRNADGVSDVCLHFFSGDLAEAVRRLPGIGTADVSTFHIEINLAAGFPADGAIVAYAQIDPKPQKLGAFVMVREFPTAASSAGWLELDKLPRAPYHLAIHFFKSDVSEVEVSTDLTKVIEAGKSVLATFAKNASPRARVPVGARATHVDFTILNGEIADLLATGGVADFRVKAHLDSAGSIDVVTETLDVLT